MINFYSFAPEIFLLILILSTLTLGLINKGSSISLNVLGFAILTIFLMFNGSTVYLNTSHSSNTINLILLSKILLSLGSLIFILLVKRPLKNENLFSDAPDPTK